MRKPTILLVKPTKWRVYTHPTPISAFSDGL
ncbi:hypothetical protein J2T37_001159 [Neisseria perflava]|nr:hypothetical protein [Neisseria perflava]MCP1771826.1 hypothetical protein [Neisseria perflava]